jgi:hypothetical protein
MRTFTLMGLFAAALIPLSLDHHSTATIETHASLPAWQLESHGSIQSVLFTAQRNIEIEVSMLRAEAAREKEFIAARNKEIADSIIRNANARPSLIAAVKYQDYLAREDFMGRFHSLSFVAARNAEIHRSMVAYDRARPALFAQARNAEIKAAMAASTRARPALIAEARIAEVKREDAFVAARNAEIEISMARVKGESALVALGRIAPYLAGPRIETGSVAK